MYTILQVAKMLDVSRQTIYNKIESIDSKYIVVKNNVKYITEEGIIIIKELICKIYDSKNESNIDKNLKLIDYLNDEIKYLREQLKTKDKLLENMQILLREEQQNIKLLKEEKPKENNELEKIQEKIINQQQEYYKKIDEKLNRWREEQQQKEEEQNKGFFNRLFNK